MHKQKAIKRQSKALPAAGAGIVALLLLASPWSLAKSVSTPVIPEHTQVEKQAGAPADVKQSVTSKRGKFAKAVANFEVNASRDKVWALLTDFPQYPRIFQRIKSVRVTKQEGDLVYIESELKPHMFVRTPRNHTVNNLKEKPNALHWQLIDGNFKEVYGHWELTPSKDNSKCNVIYTLEVDPGPVIPAFLVSFVLGFVQKEVAGSLKSVAEGGFAVIPTTSSAKSDPSHG